MLRDFLKMLLAPMAPMGFIGAIASAFAGPIIGDLFGGGGSAPSNNGSGSGGGAYNGPKYYTPTNQPGMDQNFQNSFNQYQNANQMGYDNTSGAIYNNLQNQYNNPYAGSFQNSANQSGNYYNQAAGSAASNAQGLYGAANQNYGKMQGNANRLIGAGEQNYGQMQGGANSLFSAGNQAYQTGFDPRGAIYNQNRNDLTENVRSDEYARGITMSPAGASVEANALGRFQNDWQNQQQARQIAGANEMRALYGSGSQMLNSGLSGLNREYGAGSQMLNNGLSGLGRAYDQGNQLQSQAAQYAGMAGSVPYQAQNQVNQNQRDAVSNYQGANQAYMSGLQQQQNNALAYNNYGTSAQNTAFNQNMKGLDYQNQLQQQFAPMGNQLGQAAGGALSNFYNQNFGAGAAAPVDPYAGNSGYYDPFASSQGSGFTPQGL